MFKNTEAFSSYSVDSIEEALRFYKDKLGLVVATTKEGLEITLDGRRLFLYQKPNHTPASFTVLNFVVNDIDAAVKELETVGVTLEKYDMNEMRADEKGIYRGSSTGNGPDIAWFTDPAGNILSVIQK
ncbi:MAG: glyoxalase [Parcubacteria group bacterium]|nr:glyoxalase [Parcubacteria group bacterium]